MNCSEEIVLTDGIVIPVMEKHNVSREEAEKRLRLLFQSGILSLGGPDDIAQMKRIDDFLENDSETLQGMVNHERFLTTCLDNVALVRQYDRLHFTNLTKALRKANAGLPPSNFKRQIAAFDKFITETILPTLPTQQ